MNSNSEKATFAAGCFWGVEETFRTTKGVISTQVGYIGGHQENPNYEDVCNGNTGHAEAVELVFNPNIISYQQLLKIFWDNHNPTTLNQQGPDYGTQYRSAIYYHSEKQHSQASLLKESLEKSNKWGSPIVTEIAESKTFWPAEEYHQKYLLKQGASSCPI